jgi:hypothetical protein
MAQKKKKIYIYIYIYKHILRQEKKETLESTQRRIVSGNKMHLARQ